jgi:hypothetical protein
MELIIRTPSIVTNTRDNTFVTNSLVLCCLPLESATEACANHVYCGVEDSKGRETKQGNIEHTVVPQCSVVQIEFSVYANCFVKYVWREKYSSQAPVLMKTLLLKFVV